MSNEIKLIVAIPTAGTVRMGFAYSLAGLFSYIAANGCKTRPEATLNVAMDVQESSVIHTNREQLMRRSIDKGATHLLFFDDDMVFEPSILDVLMGRRQEVVCVNYLIKTEPAAEADWVAVGLNGQRVPTTTNDSGLLPISASGFGASLFDLKAVARTPQPWFAPKFMPETSGYTTEDYPFYERLREAGATVYLDHDASKLVSHVGNKAWRWSEWTGKKQTAEVIEMSNAKEAVNG